MASVASYNKKYLRMKPEVRQIFDDLEEFKDFVRMQNPAVEFNEADLYKNTSPTWQKYIKQKARNHYHNNRR
jgi:hypothetical protein